jgi:RNA polymerase sigma-70 factor, ECF subfamily
MPNETSITLLMQAWRGGDLKSRDELVERLYPELRRLAAHYMRSERPNHTLQPTALVNELYVRCFSGEWAGWQDRAHFFAFAARKLRHILVDHARRAQMKERFTLSLGSTPDAPEVDIVALDEALHRLEVLDSRCCRVLELRFFVGLNDKEAAEVLGVSVPTVRRDFRFARTWLAAHLNPSAENSTNP